MPQDGDFIKLFVSGQSHALEQSAVSAALNMPRHKINIVGHRVGGGFGGKIFWQLPSCCAVAVAANKLRRPIRLQNDRRDEVQINGARPAINFEYETSFDSDGNFLMCARYLACCPLFLPPSLHSPFVPKAVQ